MNIKGIKLKGVSINTWDGLLDEKTITSGDLHIATKDGEAMFFHDSIDFSAYAGTDGGSTPFRFVLFDNAGLTATAYGGAAGGGEALGAENISNADFSAWTGDNPDSWVVFNEDANNYITEHVSGAQLVSNDTSAVGMFQKVSSGLSAGSLYAQTINVTVNVLGWREKLSMPVGTDFTSATSRDSATFLRFLTMVTDESITQTFYRHNDGSSDVIYTLCSFKKLTDVPATGLHLMSSKNGTTRNMASVETGFDPNAITGVKIYG